MKKIIKIGVFIAIVIWGINYLSYVFTPKGNNFNILKGYTLLPSNSIDVLFVGDSGIYSDISPMAIYEKYGFTSYDYATPAASNLLSYYMLKEALKTQTPKVVVMDETSIFGQKESEPFTRQYIDVIPNDDVKKELLNDSIYNFDNAYKIGAYINFFRYHARWNKIKSSDFQVANYDITNKGYQLYKEHKNSKINDEYMDDVNDAIDFKNSYLPESVIKSKNLCEALGIKFLLISIPDTTIWIQAKSKKMINWTKDNNISYYDLNYHFKDINLSFETDFLDEGMHLNVSGATKVSNYLGAYLLDNYNLPNHQSDPTYQSWNDDLVKYQNSVKQN
jgi:hypothetical protein